MTALTAHYLSFFIIYKPCSVAILDAIMGAFQSDGSKISDTGTAVITMKDCKAEIPPEPNEIKIKAVTPIITPQNVLITGLGSVSPLITTLIV